MKKLQITVVITLLLGLLFAAANVFASPVSWDKPKKTPGAKATDRAIQRASHVPGDNNGQDNGNGNGDGNGNGNGNGNSGSNTHGPHNTPGAKATEQADKHATKSAGHNKGPRVTYRGVVSAVESDSLTLTLDGGGSQTFLVTSATRIHIPTLGGSASLASVNVGVQALVQVLKDDTTFTAIFVNVIPGKPEPVHRVGVVTAYTPGVSITVMDKDGQSSTFLLTPDTKILPRDRASQLAVGSRVTIISRRDPTGGPLTAQGIVVHPAESESEATATGTPATATETETPTSTPTATETVEPPTDTPTATATATQ